MVFLVLYWKFSCSHQLSFLTTLAQSNDPNQGLQKNEFFAK